MFLEPPRTRGDLRWSMIGIPVRIHPLFWLVALLFSWEAARAAERPLFDLLVLVGVMLLSLLVHEFGHALTARLYGARNLRVVLYALGGLAVHDGGMPKRWQRVLELLMGPGAGFILYGVVRLTTTFLVDLSAVQPPALSHALLLATSALEWVCLWWGLVNLLPVFPLDGGQVARELLQARRPLDGGELALKLSLVTAVLAALGFLGFYIYDRVRFPEATSALGLWPVLIFAMLAAQSWLLLRQPGQAVAGWGGGEAEEPRAPWERDPDWWKS